MSLRQPKPGSIAVIGGGASGALVAANLLTRLGKENHIYLLDRTGAYGHGVAYGCCSECHLLNVRAINLSAFPDDPEHFVRWLVGNGLSEPDAAANAYVKRQYFGRYVAHVLDMARSRSKATLVEAHDTVRAIEAEHETYKVVCGDQTLMANDVVLALGNLPSRAPQPLCHLRAHPRFVEDPWSQKFLEIEPDATVLMVGTGLTMIDMALYFDGSNHTGALVARSRRGLVPQRHRLNTPVQFKESDIDRPDVVRHIAHLIKEAGDEWRAVIDGLRPHTQKIWQKLDWDYRARLMRRIQPYWDTYRHRMPNSVADRIDKMRAEGRLSIGKGHIQSAAAQGDQIVVRFTEESQPQSFDWIVNCTGPDSQWRRARDPVLESLARAGLVQYDPLGLGLMVDDDGQAIEGRRIWALGPLCRGCRWETLAMPEIRLQAHRIAERISMRIK